MNEIQIFRNDQFGEVRTAIVNNEPMFCLADLCRVLGLDQPSRVRSRLNEKGVTTSKVLTAGGEQTATFINESNLYKTIFQSRKPEAEKFSDWVTSEVLPSIRKHGAYMTEQTIEQALVNPDFLIRLATNLKEEQTKRKELEAEKQALLPKAEFYDAVAGSKDAIEMQYVAKVLAIKGLGRNNLFELLRSKGILDRNNIPYQRYIDQGYFRTIEQKYPVPTGEIRINIKTLVYQRGIDYIRKIAKEAM